MKKVTAEQRKRIFNRDGWKCRRCGTREGIHIAHGIARRIDYMKMIIRFWREEYKEELTERESWSIINHDMNLFTSCIKCNDSFNRGGKPELVKAYLLAHRLRRMHNE